MKQITIFLFLIFKAFCVLSQEEASIKIISRSMKDRILLRWGVTDPYIWKKANEFGYTISKTTISRDNKPVLPLNTQVIKRKPFKPAPLVEWEESFNEDENAAIIAHALYGESFQVENLDPVASIMAVNQEIEQRFSFAMVAAELNFNAAKLAGWGYEDTDVTLGEKYLYKIVINDFEGKEIIKESSIFVGLDDYESLPKPLNFEVKFNEYTAELNWNFSLLENIYTSYNVERSNVNGKFTKVNNYPIFNATKARKGKPVYLSYTDSIANNVKYYYKIYGINSFGQKGPYSEVKEGIAKEKLKFVPQIINKEIVTNDSVILEWNFDEKANSLIRGFELHRSNFDYDGFKVVIKNIPSEKRKIKYDKLKRINYFKIVAIGKNGDSRPSHSSIVQPIDSIPPSPPIELTGVLDTLGIVKLDWKKNTEKDLVGYRIYRSNNRSEFFQITKNPIKKETFIDTVSIRNLNKNIFYKIYAEDDRYNVSESSEILELKKPDFFPPSPPVISDYKSSEKGVQLLWIPSSSDDVKSHLVFRKNNIKTESQWELLKEILANEENTFLDKSILQNNMYSYTIVAKDNSNLESEPCTPITIEIKTPLGSDLISNFKGYSNRETRSIYLSWKSKSPEVQEFLLYKKKSKEGYNLFKTMPSNLRSFEDKDLKINSEYQYALKLVLKNGVESKLKKINVRY